MATCCKINEFDKTSQSLVPAPTSGNAGGSRSCDNGSCQHLKAEQGEGKIGLSGKENQRGLMRSVASVELPTTEAEKVIVALWKTVKKGVVQRRT